ncbi:unnamed protein product [Zymoseptoria tritici ST99CH_3D1]|nr:unnamed protein product [Zymoseptoria tritici ST99CH_3D1]
MAGLQTFKRCLQDAFDLKDAAWEYTVPNLPAPNTLDSAGKVKVISFVSTRDKQDASLRLETPASNRIVRNEPAHKLLLLSFADFKLRLPLSPGDQDVRFATARESAGYIAKLLKTGVVLNGVQYHFFGHSNSQTKSRSCYMYASSKDDLARKVEALGDFSRLKTAAKKAKRIGLLFSSAEVALELKPQRCEDIDDISRKDYTFTDGCGRIAKDFAKEVARKRNIVFRNVRYLPAVYQIRYRGYKGVLTLSPELRGKIQVQFRSSMRKFTDANDLSFSVVDYSKPYAFGYLNDEIVLLLHALGISTEALLRKQEAAFKLLRGALNGNAQTAFQFLTYQNEMALAEKLLMSGIDSVQASIRKLVNAELEKMINKRDEQRCRIAIRDSRLLFGICDPSGTSDGHGKLREGTCFVRITDHESGQARTIVNTEVLVTRNPCLHPGDLQKFEVVDIPSWTHLTDCIVFPTTGKRPSADLMSGGDLDGDKFFVTWDPEIIPRTVAQPAAYPGGQERIEFGEIDGDSRAEFFAQYSNASLGRVKNLYLKWARLGSPLSSECQQLNRLFSQCVDGNRIQVPSNLEDPPEPAKDGPTFVLDLLHEDAVRQAGTLIDAKTSLENVSGDLLDFISSREDFALSEFELIQLVFKRCNEERLSFSEYTPYFNYAALSDEQRLWLLDILPQEKHLPGLVRNGLLQSDLVHPQELVNFKLDDHRLHWKQVFSSSSDRMGQFMGTAGRVLENFHKKLIVIQADERLVLMIYVPEKIPKASEVEVSDSVRVFALPRSAGSDSAHYRVTATKSTSRLFHDDGVFQLYEQKRGNTFVYLQRGPQNLTKMTDIGSKGDRRRKHEETLLAGENYDCRASVALNKISEPIRLHVGRMIRAGIQAAEVYVISNRDVESLRFLDAWLRYVDTQEELPLFASPPKEYTAPSLETEPRDQVPPIVCSVVWDNHLHALKSMVDPGHVRLALHLLNRTGEKTRLHMAYAELLRYAHEANAAIDALELTRLLLNVLLEYHFLARLFLESEVWMERKASLADEALQVFPQVLSELALDANRLQLFVIAPVKLILRELHQISLQQLVDLVELIALAVGQPDVALDLLLECIQPELSRLLAGSPLEIHQITNHLMGIALDHIDEASSDSKMSQHNLELHPDGRHDGFEVVKTTLRIDIPEGPPKAGDHVRFVASGPPRNAPVERPYTMDAVVITSDQGSASFRCIGHTPPYLEDCSWKFRNCGSFATSKAMLDATKSFYGTKRDCCGLYYHLVGEPGPITVDLPNDPIERAIDVETKNLNDSQRRALHAALQCPLAFLWGPPGTGKTSTIVAILKTMLATFPKSRFLITAPTHNAVDNTLQRFIAEGGAKLVEPLRVATDMRKVASQLRSYTCDAMVGKDLSESHAGRRAAQKRVKASRLIFTTCVGSALGLLRNEKFDIVLVDEASQQTEPETLIPLTKGCKRAILVGDHVQLRATVQKHAVVTGFDISLFERHYELPETPGTAKVMLDTQYRMHPDICSFSSEAFYQGKLKSAPSMASIAPPTSRFPFPKTSSRKVFVQCSTTEDLGHQSKANQGQVKLCQTICGLLSDSTIPASGKSVKPEIVILTPYTRQREELKAAIPAHEVSSIDGFQGREADIIVFVTVRCNEHYDIGFLKDMRRLNVAMTRAKASVIVIGDRKTLSGQSSADADVESKAVWKRLLDSCVEVALPEGVSG